MTTTTAETAGDAGVRSRAVDWAAWTNVVVGAVIMVSTLPHPGARPAQMLTVLASAVGPLIFAQSANWTGSYFPALWVLAPCVLLVGIAACRVHLPGNLAAAP